METLESPTLNITPIIRGTDKELKLTVFESKANGIKKSLTGAKFSFELKKNLTGVTIFSKASANNGGSDSEILLDPSDQYSFSLFIIPSDTLSLTPFTYLGIITITDSSSNIYKVYINFPLI